MNVIYEVSSNYTAPFTDNSRCQCFEFCHYHTGAFDSGGQLSDCYHGCEPAPRHDTVDNTVLGASEGASRNGDSLRYRALKAVHLVPFEVCCSKQGINYVGESLEVTSHPRWR